jgi:hypothetical protein
MSALTLMIIRHAEKPKEEWPGPGLTIEGSPDGKSLVIRGWQRAGGWSALFGAGLGGTDFPRPDVFYAADPAATLSRQTRMMDPASAPFRLSPHWETLWGGSL